jgi:hypothetical protein
MRVVGREGLDTCRVSTEKHGATFSPDGRRSQIDPLKPRHSMAGCSHLFQAGGAHG